MFSYDYCWYDDLLLYVAAVIEDLKNERNTLQRELATVKQQKGKVTAHQK